MRIYAQNLVGGWRRSANPPLALLLLALSTLFLFANDRGQFYRPGHHDWLSAKYLALAENLSPEHNFALFHSLKPDQEGNPAPHFFYHRFPIGGFALIKLAILPFGDDLSAKILAGRTLMLAFFSAAAGLAFLALSRITGSRWIACAATGLAFSSYFCLYYSDMIGTEAPMDLFAVMLVFHALTIFVQEGSFRQLLAKTCIALLLGWHVYALLLPFIAFSLASEMFRARAQFPNAAPLDRMRRLAGLFFLSRPVVLGAVALAFGSLVLLLGLVSEWAAGVTPIAELPTVQSMIRRMGLMQDTSFYDSWDHHLAWPIFLENQFQILGGMILPYALPGYAHALQLGEHPLTEVMFEDMFYIGVAALTACLVGIYFTRQRILLATLTLFGFFWTLPMRNSTAFHSFEGLFYIGVPLTLFSLVLLRMRKMSGEPLMARIAVAALLVFGFSNYQMSLVGIDVEEKKFQAEVIADFQAIRSRTSEGVIGVMSKEHIGTENRAGGVPNGLRYYLTSRVFVAELYQLEFAVDKEKLKAMDFIVTDWREPSAATLTPQNRRYFLYDKADYVGPYESLLGNLLAQSNFDVYRKGNALNYLKSPCTEEDTAARFLLHVFPMNLADLPEDRRRHGFDNLDFTFSRHGAHFGAGAALACTARVSLPTYDIEKISTGQFDQQGPIWWEDFPLR